jgi:hypothetical protein
MEPICCPETSVRNHHYSLRNNPEDCIFFKIKDMLPSVATRRLLILGGMRLLYVRNLDVFYGRETRGWTGAVVGLIQSQ